MTCGYEIDQRDLEISGGARLGEYIDSRAIDGCTAGANTIICDNSTGSKLEAL